MKILNFIVFLFLASFEIVGQKDELRKSIDILIDTSKLNIFNGIISIYKSDELIYEKVKGFSDIENKINLKIDDQFVIGSISKQFTAVLVLREFEKGKIGLFESIDRYLPEIKKDWAKKVTVHQLLTHTHGIRSLKEETAFEPGSKFEYSQIGYDLLSKIIEKSSDKSFEESSNELFEECKMKNTCHPNSNLQRQLVKGYTKQENGEILFENESLSSYVAAGGFISTISDLKIWNDLFYNGKLLKKKTMKLVTSKQEGAIRNHPIFGITEYGYGITIESKDGVLRYGQTGFAPGFVSMNFYFPKNKISAIVLMNVVFDENDLKEAFKFHVEILNLLNLSKLLN